MPSLRSVTTTAPKPASSTGSSSSPTAAASPNRDRLATSCAVLAAPSVGRRQSRPRRRWQVPSSVRACSSPADRRGCAPTRGVPPLGTRSTRIVETFTAKHSARHRRGGERPRRRGRRPGFHRRQPALASWRRACPGANHRNGSRAAPSIRSLSWLVVVHPTAAAARATVLHDRPLPLTTSRPPSTGDGRALAVNWRPSAESRRPPARRARTMSSRHDRPHATVVVAMPGRRLRPTDQAAEQVMDLIQTRHSR